MCQSNTPHLMAPDHVTGRYLILYCPTHVEIFVWSYIMNFCSEVCFPNILSQKAIGLTNSNKNPTLLIYHILLTAFVTSYISYSCVYLTIGDRIPPRWGHSQDGIHSPKQEESQLLPLVLSASPISCLQSLLRIIPSFLCCTLAKALYFQIFYRDQHAQIH